MLFKSIEIPNPDPEPQQNAQQAPKNLDELETQNILVEIDANGQIMVDHEPITPSQLVPKLRAAREATGRTGMILMADLATAHKNAVLAYDAATEVGLSIKIGRPPTGMGNLP
jgi:biopolymer transport protein ExbD